MDGCDLACSKGSEPAASAAGVPLDSVQPVEPLEPLPVGHPEAPWYALGATLESRLDDAHRRRQGSHFTPPWLARKMAERVVDESTDPVIDPACGAGVFLVAAADRLVACGVEPLDALRRLRGHDTDPIALEATELALRWWAHGVGADWPGVRLDTNDPLRAPLAATATSERGPVVLGNPPFLDQLDKGSARDEARRALLVERYGNVVAAYTDEAGVFLAWAIEAVGAKGRVALVLPRSLLSARDAEGVRRHVSSRSRLAAAWFDQPDTFGAGVHVWVLVADARHVGPVEVRSGPGLGEATAMDAPDPASWSPLLAATEGVPEVVLATGSPLRERAEVVAGFRDEYYGLVGAVRDGGRSPAGPRLLTAGVIDPAHDRWARRPVRFAKRSWERPTVDLGAIDSPRARRWVEKLLVPKVLVATQTRVVEAVVDDDGDAVGSVPVLNVVPNEPADRWHLAAALSAPAVSAWVLQRVTGTALSAGTIKLAAEGVRSIPLPTDRSSWDRGAAAFRDAQRAVDADERLAALRRLGTTMSEAYGTDERVLDWWWQRLVGS